SSHDLLAEDLLLRSRSTPFNLESGPVVRFDLLPLSPSEHLLLIALPAVSADPWTLDRLVSEICDAYAGETNGDTEPIQYVQYSEWQNGLLEEQEAEEGRRFWRATLEIPALTLPFESREASPDGLFLPRRIAVPVAPRLAAGIERLCTRQGTSLPDFLLGCWQLLLWRISGQDEVVVRRIFDGRKLEELHEGIGLFAKYLPVGVDFGADLCLNDLWPEVRRAVGEASLWQEYFTEELAETGGEGSPLCHPVLFDYEERSEMRFAGEVCLSVRGLYHCLEPFAIRLTAIRRAGGLGLELHFDPRQFSDASMQRLADWYAALLRSVVRNPHARAADVDFLAEAERHQLLQEWNGSAVAASEGDFLHHLFESRARLHPEAPAVSHGNVELTYGELDGRANRLAHHLRALGAGPEVRVGILLERSVELVVAILGILKAGGAYVPLDPGQPDRRLALILEDSRAALVVTQESLRGRLSAMGAAGVCLDADAASIAARSVHSPRVLLSPSNLAYVIYTSGSTGVPKGVMICHRSLAHLPAALDEAVVFKAGPLRVGLNAPISFDASVKQLAQISRGHRLFIVPEQIRADGWELLAFAAEHRLDVLDTTPAQVRLMLEAGLEARPELRASQLLVGGEVIDQPLWERLSGPDMPCFDNVYGPTECTVDATAWRVRSSPD